MYFSQASYQGLFSQLQTSYRLQRSFAQLFKKTVILLAGPTGSGKTDVSLYLAPMINGEIISVDSMQVYCGMDIGTAKVSLEQRNAVPHFLIDVCHVQDVFNVVDFYYQAMQACQSILERNKVPILVGGTGFYFHAFLFGPPQGPPPDLALRSHLEKNLEEQGVATFYAMLVEQDPQYAKTITKHDKNKIIRALEIMHLTGKKVSEHAWMTSEHEPLGLDFRCWFLSPPKELLKARIECRCEDMLQLGLVDEVAALMQQGICQNPTASKAIGYREWIEFLENGAPHHAYEETKQLFVRNSWRYTKKQRTWFKRYPMFRSIETEGVLAQTLAEKIAEDYFMTQG